MSEMNCDYIFNEEYGADLDDCPSCRREKDRTCPTEIYDDTIICFPKEIENDLR